MISLFRLRRRINPCFLSWGCWLSMRRKSVSGKRNWSSSWNMIQASYSRNVCSKEQSSGLLRGLVRWKGSLVSDVLTLLVMRCCCLWKWGKALQGGIVAYTWACRETRNVPVCLESIRSPKQEDEEGCRQKLLIHTMWRKGVHFLVVDWTWKTVFPFQCPFSTAVLLVEAARWLMPAGRPWIEINCYLFISCMSYFLWEGMRISFPAIKKGQSQYNRDNANKMQKIPHMVQGRNPVYSSPTLVGISCRYGTTRDEGELFE